MRTPRPRPASGARLWLALAFLLSVAGCAPGSEPPERIVLIVVDTLRRDHVSSYGSPRPTPNIDALAARGQALPGALSSFHQTSMSMGALFTGRTPSLEREGSRESLAWNGRTWCGLARFADPGGEVGCIPKRVGTLGHAMQEAGYRTMAVVTNQLLFRPAGFERGFDVWEELRDPEARRFSVNAGTTVLERSSRAADVNKRVAEILEARTSDRFFLYVHYMDVHDYGLLGRPYGDMVKELDHAIGELLGDLDRRGLLAGAVVVLTSDHGERLGEEHLIEGWQAHTGNPSFDEVLAVPLIIAPPRLPEARVGLRSEDVFRLLVELAGGSDAPESEIDADELFVSEMFWQTYRRGRFKSYAHRWKGDFHLVDLEEDPGETADVAGDFSAVAEAHRSRVAELSQQLATGRSDLGELSEEDRRRLRALGYLE